MCVPLRPPLRPPAAAQLFFGRFYYYFCCGESTHLTARAGPPLFSLFFFFFPLNPKPYPSPQRGDVIRAFLQAQLRAGPPVQRHRGHELHQLLHQQQDGPGGAVYNLMNPVVKSEKQSTNAILDASLTSQAYNP